MNKLKKFIEQKKVDKKFRKAGKGMPLCAPVTPSAPSASHQTSDFRLPNVTDERRQIASQLADAHERRLCNADKNLTYAQKKIRELAKKELEEEQIKEQSKVITEQDARKDDRDGEMLFEHNDQVSSVRFTCDLFNEDIVLPKREIIEAVEQYLMKHLDEEPIEASIIMIWSLNNKDRVDAAVPVLAKYIGNILRNPEEPKFRKIRTSNTVFLDKVDSLKGAKYFLAGCGFKDTTHINPDGTIESFLVFEDMNDSEVLHRLEDALICLESGAPILLKLYRDAKFYRLDADKPIPRPDVPADFFMLSPEEVQREQKLREQETERLQTLKTSKMREEDQRLRKYNYRYTLIRVRFPDHFIVQGVFGVHESISTLREFVATKLAIQHGTFSFSDPTALDKRFDDEEKSFAHYGLMPAAVLHFEWDEETVAEMQCRYQSLPYLHSSYVSGAEVL